MAHWRGENRDFELHSKRLNQISNEPPNENDETNDHRRLNYISNEPSKENEVTNDGNFCHMMRENKKNTSNISQDRVSGKENTERPWLLMHSCEE